MKKIVSNYKLKFKEKVENAKTNWRSFFESMWLREKVLLAFLLFIIAIPVFMLLFRFLSSYIITFPVDGGFYTEGIVGQPQVINPLYSSSSKVDRSIEKLIYSGLTKKDKSGKIIPDISEGWEVSQDQKQFTFHIRKNVYWHDGEQLFSQDVFYTYSIAQDPDYLGPLKGQFKNVQMELPDEYTIIFKLAKEDLGFLEKTTLGIIPQHRWAQYSVADIPYIEENLRPVGSGMFYFKEAETKDDATMTKMTLARNESFYLDKPYLEGVILKFYNNNIEVKDALLKKDIDGTFDISSSFLQEIDKVGRLRIVFFESLGYRAIFPNTAKAPLFSDKNFRKAFDLAIDKEKLIRDDFHDSVGSVLGPFPGKKKDYDYSLALEESKKIMKSLGAIDSNNDGVFEISNQPLSFKLSIIDDEESKIVANRIKNDLMQIGISIEIERSQGSEFERDILSPRNYQLLFLGQSYGEDKNLYSLWHSSQTKSPGLCFSSVTSKRVDALLENYIKEKNIETKEDIGNTVGNILEADNYGFFLYQPIYNFVTDKKIKGIMKNYFVYPENRFININKWYIKTGWAFRG